MMTWTCLLRDSSGSSARLTGAAIVCALFGLVALVSYGIYRLVLAVLA